MRNLQISAIIVLIILAVGFIQYQRKDAANSAVSKARIEAMEKTEKEIAKITDIAERARLMRRHCTDNGMRFDFGNIKCVK